MPNKIIMGARGSAKTFLPDAGRIPDDVASMASQIITIGARSAQSIEEKEQAELKENGLDRIQSAITFSGEIIKIVAKYTPIMTEAVRTGDVLGYYFAFYAQHVDINDAVQAFNVRYTRR